tara:strand:+ start:156 stop:656 length:501 start_codon:yes stop_codon:yes gene_type:complete
MIEVYDDFFDDHIRKEIFDLLMKPHWGLSGGNDNKPEIFWHYDGLEGNLHRGYFTEFLYEKICKKLGREFKGFQRIYANGQTAGQCGTPHYDDGDLTFLYYPSPVWDIKWQGHLMFMDENDEVVRVVEHKANRAVLFPGTIKHYADAPHRWFNGLRISLAYKLWKK